MEIIAWVVPVATLLAVTAGLISLLRQADRRFDAERAQWAAERERLIALIQAPEQAPTIIAPEPTGERLYVEHDNDDDHAAYLEAVEAGELA